MSPPAARNTGSRFYAYLDPRTALTTLEDGQVIYVDPADEQMTTSLIVYGNWEPWLGPVIRRMVRRRDRVLEVGANAGYYTLLLASAVGPLGHVDSFEANPRIARLLDRSIECNGLGDFVTLHRKIAADRNGVMTFASSTRSTAGGCIFENGRDFGDETCFDEVEAVRLDDLFPGQSFDFVRTDAEGSEILILNGAMGILERSPSIKLCVEWSPQMMQRRGDVAALAGRLAAMGFKFWRIDNPSGLDPNPLTAAEVARLGHSDIVIARELSASILYPRPVPLWKRSLRLLARGLTYASR